MLCCRLASNSLTATCAHHFVPVLTSIPTEETFESAVLVEQDFPGSGDLELLYQTAERKLQLGKVVGLAICARTG